MVRIKQFADDLAISTKKAKDLINKGRNRKDGGSKILESVMSDTDKKKNKKKKTKKLKPQIMPRIEGRGRYKSDDEPPIMPRIEGRGRYTPDDKPQIMPREGGRTPSSFSLKDLKEMGIDPRTMSKGGSNVTTMNTDKLSKAQLAQFTNIKNDAVNGKISPAEAQKMIRKMLTIKRKDGGLQDIPSDNKGLPNLPTEVRNKMGYKKNGGMQTSPKQKKHGTAKGMGTGLSKKPQIVKSPHARGGGIAIQGLGFRGVR